MLTPSLVREAASDNRATTYSPREATMSDLTKQLRDPNYIGQEGMRNAAADEIDRLQSALAAAERSNDRHVDEKLTLAANLREALQQLTAAQARIAELEKLLPKPRVGSASISFCGCRTWDDGEGNSVAVYCGAHRPEQPPTARDQP